MILYQVNKILCKQYIVNHFRRQAHNRNHLSTKVLYPLQSRGLLKVTGKDASVFLQGLVTNDMRHFEEGARSIYTMFLNNKGRVLYDTLIHRWDKENSYMVECDKSLVSIFQKHLKLYKLKREVNIEDVNNDFRLWAVISPPDYIPNTDIDPENQVQIYKDPRISDLGYRIITRANFQESNVVDNFGKDVAIESNESGYKLLRYKLGVSEGSEDLQPGQNFPLEVNCDYLHGVSFHKGCYIGQELTARVHHTGVVRKRIMPIEFCDLVTEELEKDTVISSSDNPKANLGKLKGYMGNYGIGLIRVKEAMESKKLFIGKYKIVIVKPTWWPIEAPKEVAKSE